MVKAVTWILLACWFYHNCVLELHEWRTQTQNMNQSDGLIINNRNRVIDKCQSKNKQNKTITDRTGCLQKPLEQEMSKIQNTGHNDSIHPCLKKGQLHWHYRCVVPMKGSCLYIISLRTINHHHSSTFPAAPVWWRVIVHNLWDRLTEMRFKNGSQHFISCLCDMQEMKKLSLT